MTTPVDASELLFDDMGFPSVPPTGPRRIGTTVRVLAELSDALTAACQARHVSRQDILDEALAEWLRQHGFMPQPPAREAVNDTSGPGRRRAS